MSHATSTLANQRQTRRVACRIRAHLICDTGLKLACETLDLSEGGIRVMLASSLKENQGHTIEAVQLRGVQALAVQMRWVRDLHVGLAFTGNAEQRTLVRALLIHLEKARAEALKARAQARPS